MIYELVDDSSDSEGESMDYLLFDREQELLTLSSSLAYEA